MPNNYVLLQRVEVGAAGAASVSFTNIPQTGYSDLKVVMSTRVSATASPDFLEMSVNGSLANFTSKRIQGNGASASSSSFTNSYSVVETNNLTANTFGSVEIYCPNYTSSNAKSFSVEAVTENNATTAHAEMWAWLWNQTAAITSLGFARTSGTFLANSTFSLYAMAAVGVTPTVAPKASGGSITTDGTYWYHTFRSSGNFVPQVGLTCDALVVAGGGAAGDTYGGGGGAGGLRYLTSQSVSATNYTITVGAGGAAVPAGIGSNGTSSSALGSSTVGGGGGAGGTGSATAGSTGGSGGGGEGFFGGAGGLGTSGEGQNGGAGRASSIKAAGGGGGKVGVGGSASGTVAGSGGAGYEFPTGSGNYYAGGGGAGADGSGSATAAGTGGIGGGGNGAIATFPTAVNGTAGTANTGGGGGGGSQTGDGAAGGSGIVILRYLVA